MSPWDDMRVFVWFSIHLLCSPKGFIWSLAQSDVPPIFWYLQVVFRIDVVNVVSLQNRVEHKSSRLCRHGTPLGLKSLIALVRRSAHWRRLQGLWISNPPTCTFWNHKLVQAAGDSDTSCPRCPNFCLLSWWRIWERQRLHHFVLAFHAATRLGTVCLLC